jgi:hypothetical protein
MLIAAMLTESEGCVVMLVFIVGFVGVIAASGSPEDKHFKG